MEFIPIKPLAARGAAHPEGVQGTADRHHERAHAFLPPSDTRA